MRAVIRGGATNPSAGLLLVMQSLFPFKSTKHEENKYLNTCILIKGWINKCFISISGCWALPWPHACRGHEIFDSSTGSIRGEEELMLSIYSHEECKYKYSCIFRLIMYVGEVQGRETRAKVKLASIRVRVRPSSPTSVSVLRGCAKSTVKRYIRVIFRQNTEKHTSFCKVFFPEKCMNSHWDSKCGSHAWLKRLHSCSHDSRLDKNATYPCFQNSTWSWASYL